MLVSVAMEELAEHAVVEVKGVGGGGGGRGGGRLLVNSDGENGLPLHCDLTKILMLFFLSFSLQIAPRKRKKEGEEEVEEKKK